ncbi:hypothetical protein P4O66_004539 [Electrophorus voltai]|uniref:Spermatogenesis-associated protein 2 PUB-like domain-containing protein n=1 Tax=Electrophorus voltai TaxID=2609070 RepID=A0AAD8ZMJ2_9TELE|nr:hypothetical protein P4O66_004539 [Electrophorus voltai]
MGTKLREDLFRRYVSSLDERLEGGAGAEASQSGACEEALVSTATALLGVYQPEPGHRFRMIRFYDMVENSLGSVRGASLQTLETAFATLELICTNLLLFPWKKEFRCIKTFTGPYVYQLQSVLCDCDLRAVLRSMGYSRDQEPHYLVREHPAAASHLRQLAFELLLAQAECRLLAEVVSLSRGAASELDAVELRRTTREDAVGCADALRRRDGLTGEVAQLTVRAADADRAVLRRSGRPSRSVDVTDSAGHWHPASKPVLKASLSLRREPLFVDTEEDLKDEIIRPTTSLHPPATAHNSALEFYPVQSPPSEPYPYHLPCLDEIDLYTERGLSGRQTTSRPPSREARDGWALKAHGPKCQGCGLSCPALTSCPGCDMILCPSCHTVDPTPCCGFQDYPKSSRPLDGYVPMKEKLSVYSSAHSHTHPHPLSHAHAHSPLLDKPVISTKLFPSKPLALSAVSGAPAGPAGSASSRCGFCNKPGASHTCVNCSKVSCDSCMSLYAGDMCTRKNLPHSFVANHQLNYKSSTISHLVYR